MLLQHLLLQLMLQADQVQVHQVMIFQLQGQEAHQVQHIKTEAQEILLQSLLHKEMQVEEVTVLMEQRIMVLVVAVVQVQVQQIQVLELQAELQEVQEHQQRYSVQFLKHQLMEKVVLIQVDILQVVVEGLNKTQELMQVVLVVEEMVNLVLKLDVVDQLIKVVVQEDVEVTVVLV